ncbi:Endonuclease V [Thalassoglobus neptunius]|uniref:Endonuclease V n=1 Tax=Thalassoglobus neptunius TaxID=1938619 RepID=A0A5C5WPW8_9PLAN|nr:endonuclease V [Thalassoglobus neptunius]TWT52305.1 Endonuclease V [Thalassoglobus neptunius]
MTYTQRLPTLPNLHRTVLQLVRQIPSGRTTTYGDISRALGDQQTRSARWIGELLKNHPHSSDCPCHRVVRANGELGHYVTGSPEEKRNRLQSEGVEVSESGVVDLDFRFQEFESKSPLRELQKLQLEFADSARLSMSPEMAKTIPADAIVAGVDVAYPEPGWGVGAYVEVDPIDQSVLYRKTIRVPVSFPYLPGYLTFRELPVLLPLLDEVSASRPLAKIIFVDGNGILHPLSAGIATALGSLTDLPTIGVAKSLLCGGFQREEMRKGETRPVLVGDETRGFAFQSTDRSPPIFISPGYGISSQDAIAWTRKLMGKTRLPVPIHLADRLTKNPAVADPILQQTRETR